MELLSIIYKLILYEHAIGGIYGKEIVYWKLGLRFWTL